MRSEKILISIWKRKKKHSNHSIEIEFLLIIQGHEQNENSFGSFGVCDESFVYIR